MAAGPEEPSRPGDDERIADYWPGSWPRPTPPRRPTATEVVLSVALEVDTGADSATGPAPTCSTDR
ncbi:hypothetical protein LT493_22145 [Streptomyces tricolor]|nr:hypothetical protein [Streptomyces tricolor]